MEDLQYKKKLKFSPVLLYSPAVLTVDEKGSMWMHPEEVSCPFSKLRVNSFNMTQHLQLD